MLSLQNILMLGFKKKKLWTLYDAGCKTYDLCILKYIYIFLSIEILFRSDNFFL